MKVTSHQHESTLVRSEDSLADSGRTLLCPLEVMEFSGQRPNLDDVSLSRRGSFVLSLIFGTLAIGLLTGALAAFVYPELIKPNQVVQVISSPPLPEFTEPDLPSEPSHRTLPPPIPPAQPPVVPSPSRPSTPLLVTQPEVTTDFLVADSEAALETIALLQEEEEMRLAELLEKEERERKTKQEAALLAQQKAVEKEAQRQKEAAARAIAARAEQARRAQEQAVASKEAETRRAQKQALAAQQAQERRATAQADAQRQAAAQAATEARRVASRASLQKTSTPSYPTSARRNGLQGTTRIQATVTTSGKISSPQIIASSGHRSLDSSALKAVKKYRFSPARNGLGNPIADQVVIPVTFRLQ